MNCEHYVSYYKDTQDEEQKTTFCKLTQEQVGCKGITNNCEKRNALMNWVRQRIKILMELDMQLRMRV